MFQKLRRRKTEEGAETKKEKRMPREKGALACKVAGSVAMVAAVAALLVTGIMSANAADTYNYKYRKIYLNGGTMTYATSTGYSTTTSNITLKKDSDSIISGITFIPLSNSTYDYTTNKAIGFRDALYNNNKDAWVDYYRVGSGSSTLNRTYFTNSYCYSVSSSKTLMSLNYSGHKLMGYYVILEGGTYDGSSAAQSSFDITWNSQISLPTKIAEEYYENSTHDGSEYGDNDWICLFTDNGDSYTHTKYGSEVYELITKKADSSGTNLSTKVVYLPNNLGFSSGANSYSYVGCYALWAKDSNGTLYKVTYNLNGGSHSTSASIQGTSTRSSATSNVVQQLFYYNLKGDLYDFTPTRTGYTFKNWNTKADGSGTSYSSGAAIKMTSDTTLYAQWTANPYTIVYNGNGNTNTSTTMSNTSTTYGTNVTLRTNKFTKTGYTFLGWSTDSSATTATYTDGQTVKNLTSTKNGTVILYAVWQANTITVKYIANGGSGTTPDSTYTYGVSTPLSTNGFTRTGYTFVGWYAYRDVDGKYYYQSTDGSTNSSGKTTGWYKEGDQPDGWVYYVYKSAQKVSATASSGTVYMYSLWSKDGAGWTMEDVIQDSYMFYKASSLVGGEKTTWDGGYIDSQRAKVDEGTEDPGYFTQDPY